MLLLVIHCFKFMSALLAMSPISRTAELLYINAVPQT